jgi:hypothetical protein
MFLNSAGFVIGTNQRSLEIKYKKHLKTNCFGGITGINTTLKNSVTIFPDHFKETFGTLESSPKVSHHVKGYV